MRDAALIMNVIAVTIRRIPPRSTRPSRITRRALEKDLQGIRVGLPKEYMIEGIDPQVRDAINAAVKQLNCLGAEIVDVSLPSTELRGRGLLHYCHRGGFGEPRAL